MAPRPLFRGWGGTMIYTAWQRRLVVLIPPHVPEEGMEVASQLNGLCAWQNRGMWPLSPCALGGWVGGRKD